MGGRADYEERREARRLRYEELSKKAEERSNQYSNSKANRILSMTSRTANYNRTSFWKDGKKTSRESLARYWKINRRR